MATSFPSIRIEGGRDVLISGNKIVNGWVFKSGDARNKCSGGAVTVIGNEFTSDLPVPHGVIGLGSGTDQAIVKDNVMRFTAGQPAVTAPREIVQTNQDEAVSTHPEEKLQAALPAISNLSGARTMTLLLIEGNVIQGWVGEAIDLSAVRRDSEPIRFIVRNNSVEGAIRLTGLPASYRGLVTNNINLKTLEPVQAVLVPQEPAGK